MPGFDQKSEWANEQFGLNPSGKEMLPLIFLTSIWQSYFHSSC
jgi:hypothetical protein